MVRVRGYTSGVHGVPWSFGRRPIRTQYRAQYVAILGHDVPCQGIDRAVVKQADGFQVSLEDGIEHLDYVHTGEGVDTIIRERLICDNLGPIDLQRIGQLSDDGVTDVGLDRPIVRLGRPCHILGEDDGICLDGLPIWQGLISITCDMLRHACDRV